ncbi:MAG: hypothetical protein BMS9Abin04_435 [Planctomycetia bacterium]|nr:MAG: hypothetical protein BMS9Abin04_435 [Planctomycetia bacterium]
MLTDLVDGPNRQGRVLEEIQSELSGSESIESDPLADRRLPRSYRQHAREYFERFRQGR